MSKRLGGKLDMSETEDLYYIRVEFAEHGISLSWKTFYERNSSVYVCESTTRMNIKSTWISRHILDTQSHNWNKPYKLRARNSL